MLFYEGTVLLLENQHLIPHFSPHKKFSKIEKVATRIHVKMIHLQVGQQSLFKFPVFLVQDFYNFTVNLKPEN